MLGAVIFDFDGVIADSEMLHLRAFNEVLGRFGVTISTEDYYTHYLGLSDRDLFSLFAGKKLLNIDASGIGDLINVKNQIFTRLARKEAHIIDGVPDFLQLLKKNGAAMAICSGALLCEIKLILEASGLDTFFDVIVSAEEVSRGKPDAEGFLLTLKKLNEKRTKPFSNKDCVVIEDSHWGLEAAQAAGMHTVAITNSYDAEKLALAERIISHLNELSIEELQALCG